MALNWLENQQNVYSSLAVTWTVFGLTTPLLSSLYRDLTLRYYFCMRYTTQMGMAGFETTDLRQTQKWTKQKTKKAEF